jgi:hypothetical protein
MVPMKCQRCGSSAIRAVSTNNREADATIRKRMCSQCEHSWFTVEVPVSPVVVGWCSAKSNGGQSKPVLRVPVALAIGEGAV